MNQRIAAMIELATVTQVDREYLILYPASGRALRRTGKVCALAIDGQITPFLCTDREIYAMDPRLLILNESTLKIVYNPREHVGMMHPACKEWMERNPDLYATKIPDDHEPKPLV